MIRILHVYFPARTLVLGVSEACLVALAFVAAAIARLGADEATLMLNYEQGAFKILVVSAVFVSSMYYFDLYDPFIVTNRRELLTRMIQVFGTACILLAVLYYFYPSLRLGRGIFLIGFILVTLLLLSWRRIFLAVNSLPQLTERVLILGEGPLAQEMVSIVGSRPELGLRVVGQIPEGIQSRRASSSIQDTADAFLNYVKFYRPSRIIVTMKDRRGRLPVEQLLLLKSRGLLIQDGAEVYETVTGKVPLESLSLGWLLFSPGFRLARPLQIYKRLISMLVSVIGLLLFLPLIPLIALAIKLTSPGPILYRQKRVGRDNAVFNCHKFRTMRADAEADTGPTWSGDDDPRITSVGRFLRLSRLDEIPQLWNVLKGDMSIVGPRPERPEFVEWLDKEIPHYHLRHTIRPGITGWAQVCYRYGSSVEDAKEKLRYDLFYLKNISVGLDLLILLQTIKIILLGRGAK